MRVSLEKVRCIVIFTYNWNLENTKYDMNKREKKIMEENKIEVW